MMRFKCIKVLFWICVLMFYFLNKQGGNYVVLLIVSYIDVFLDVISGKFLKFQYLFFQKSVLIVFVCDIQMVVMIYVEVENVWFLCFCSKKGIVFGWEELLFVVSFLIMLIFVVIGEEGCVVVVILVVCVFIEVNCSFIKI